MPVSEARRLANIANAARSTGPRSISGRNRSAQNSLKHGMTGASVVIPAEDQDEVERRNDALRAELAPRSSMGVILVRQMAMLSVRMERGAKQESAAIAERVRHAADDFDEERIERAEQLLQAIGEDPRGNLRRLKKMPEGVIRLGRAWSELRPDLAREPKANWTASHLVRVANLTGLREEDARGSRLGVLSRAAWGDFEALADHEGRGLDDDARRAWARARLLERIDAEVAGLEAHLETLDFETIEQDRAEAGDRALFDPSKEAALARRYESEARRGFFQALKEFRRVESEVIEREELAAATPPPAYGQPLDPLGSFREEAPPAPRDPAPARHEVPTMPFRAPRADSPMLQGGFRGADGVVDMTIGLG